MTDLQRLSFRFRYCSATAALVGFALTFGALTPGLAQGLPNVLERSLKNHPKLVSSVASARGTEFEIEQARAAKRWRMGVVGDLGKAQNFGGATNNSGSDLAVRGYYPVYDGSRADNEIERQQARYSASAGKVRQTREQLALQLVDTYIEVFKQRELAALVGEQAASIGDLYKKVEEIAQLDRGRASELIQVGVRLQQVKSTQQSRLNSAQESLALLNDLAAFPVSVGALQVLPKQDPSWPSGLAVALSLLEDHPAMELARFDSKAAQKAAQIAAAWNKPKVEVQTGVISPYDRTGSRRYLSGVDVRLSVNWQPVDGGAGAAGASALSLQAAAAEVQIQAVKKELSSEVARLWTQVTAREEQAKILSDLAVRAQVVREAYWEQFKIGRRSVLDLLNADNETFQARISARQEQLEAIQAQHRLLAAMGRLGIFFQITNIGVDQLGSSTP
jgi:outer membrane protein TolC